MSNVLVRFRNLSDMEFYANMLAVQRSYSTMLMGKLIQKKYRFIYATPTMQLIESVLDEIVRANGIYTDTVEKVEEKKKRFTWCIRQCDVLYRRLQTLIETVWYQRLHENEQSKARHQLELRIERLAWLIDREETLLSGARSKVKLVGNKKPAERKP